MESMKFFLLAIINALGNPGVIVFVATTTAPLLEKMGHVMISDNGDNTTKIQGMLYLPCALLIYTAWVFAIFLVLHTLKPSIDFQTYMTYRYSWWSLITCAVGIFTLYIYFTQGMEANVFGFVFFLPLILSFLGELVLFFFAMRAFWKM